MGHILVSAGQTCMAPNENIPIHTLLMTNQQDSLHGYFLDVVFIFKIVDFFHLIHVFIVYVYVAKKTMRFFLAPYKIDRADGSD